jgi:hypothetical protein
VLVGQCAQRSHRVGAPYTSSAPPRHRCVVRLEAVKVAIGEVALRVERRKSDDDAVLDGRARRLRAQPCLGLMASQARKRAYPYHHAAVTSLLRALEFEREVVTAAVASSSRDTMRSLTAST